MKKITRLLLVLVTFIYGGPAFAQTKMIRGEISDAATHTPLEGVTVQLKGGSATAISDAKGNFSISIPSKDTASLLIFSFVGYITREVRPGAGGGILVAMTKAATSMDEVVVVAYGTQKKTSLTAAVATVNAKRMTDIPSADISNALGGRAPGVLFKQSGGEPGKDEATIRIRGVGTIGNADPLVIVDGVERPLSSVDPHDVAAFSVLKDAASVAPYGVRGANGIILITTKRGGTNGKFSIVYDGKTGWTRPAMLPEEVSGYEWALLKNEAARNEGVAEPYNTEALMKLQDGSDPDHYGNVNGVNEIIKTGKLQQHNLSVSGGNQHISFYGSLGYVDQVAMWGKSTRFKRYTIRSNIDARITGTTKLGVDFTGIYRDAVYPGTGQGAGYILMGLWRLNPTNPIFYSNGRPAGYFERNPYLDINESGYAKEDFYAQMVTLKLEQKVPFLPGLVLRANFSVDKSDTLQKTWRTPYTYYIIQDDGSFKSGIGNVPRPGLSEGLLVHQRMNTQIMAAYNKTMGKNAVDLLAVFEPRIDRYKTLGAGITNYQLAIDELSVSGNSNPADRTVSGGSSKITQVGYVYKAGYNYDQKYFFEAAGRYDGQSYFSPAAKYAFFPSFSAAWRINEEGFMKNSPLISNLKIRGSWGKVGNLADASFQYLRLFQLGPVYLFNNTAAGSVYEVREPSPNITWEKSTKANIGLELGMWQGLLNIEADYFKERRSDMLINTTAVLPLEYGIGIGQENTGIMDNQGVDIKIASSYNFTKNLTAYGAVNFTYAKNKIVNINEAQSIRDNPNRTQVGKPLNQPFGYEALGLFQSQEEIDATPYAKALKTVKPGDIKYLDLNNDGKLDNDDVKPIGLPNFPEIVYGFESGIRFRNIQLDMLWQGAARVSYYLSGWANVPFIQGNGVAFKHQMDVWRPDNPDAEFPRILSNPRNYAYNQYKSSFWQRNGNYLRLKSLSLGYTFNNLFGGAIKACKLYAAGQNLLTFTKIRYSDPENANTTDYYYQERALSAGITLTF